MCHWPSAVSPCAGTLWWRSIFALFQFFSFFGCLWPNPMFFFSMAFFRFCRTSQTCHVVIQSPKPQPGCPPTMWWRSILAGFAIFVPGQGVPGPQGGAKGGKLLWNVQSAQHAKFRGQTKCPALGVARPHDALPCTGGQMGWWFARLGAFSAQGGPFGCCKSKCGAAASLVCESAKNGPLPAKNCKPVAGSARLAHCFSKTTPKKRCLASHGHRGKCC